MNIWLTSDPHFGHANIIKYCKRPFENAHIMDETMIQRWNERVQPDDVVYVLGDMMFGLWRQHPDELLKRLMGTKILIMGNHDPANVVNSDLWEETHDYLQIKYNGEHIKLFHFPIESWHHKERGALHFHGHSHGNSRKQAGRLDVGVDCFDFYPIHIEEAIKSARSIAVCQSGDGS